MSEFDVTVAVCTFNRSAELAQALESLFCLVTASQPRYEILVVDNASTDQTSSVIERAAAESPVAFRSLVEDSPGVSMARNAAVKNAGGSWVAFFDDDQLADPDWLQELWNTAQGQGARVVAGARDLLISAEQHQRLPAVCRRELGELLESGSCFRYSGEITGSTGNMLIQRSVFDEVGLFSERSVEGGEDTDLNRRVSAKGIESWYTPHALVHHFVPPYRLEVPYLRWTCRRVGVQMAWRERKAFGWVRFLAMFAARIGQATLVFFPSLVRARLTGDDVEVLGSTCLMWRAGGYFRTGLNILAPSIFRQESFMNEMEFRSERLVFGRDDPSCG